MATFIFVDGLGCNPYITFAPLLCRLSLDGHHSVVVEVRGIVSHDDRINRAIKAFEKECEEDSYEKIFFVGQSAGAGAVRVAAEKIGVHPLLAGIIFISSSMPRFKWYVTSILGEVMMAHAMELFFGLNREIALTREEYKKLLTPVSEKSLDLFMQNRLPISSQEARELAFLPERLRKCPCPVLLVYGTCDNWIKPSAQVKLAKALAKNTSVDVQPIIGAGHLVMMSDEDIVIGAVHNIVNWYDRHV